MNFSTSVSTVLSKYAVFQGRARRSEYWWFALFNFLIGLIVAAIDAAIGSSILGIIVTLVFLLPGLGVLVRRLHDTGRTGWWFWIALIPLVGFIVLIVFLCQDSQQYQNKYGPSPKYGPGGYGYRT